jgi:hypothetical protein
MIAIRGRESQLGGGGAIIASELANVFSVDIVSGKETNKVQAAPKYSG